MTTGYIALFSTFAALTTILIANGVRDAYPILGLVLTTVSGAFTGITITCAILHIAFRRLSR